MDPSEPSAYLLEHAQWRLHVHDVKAHYIASLYGGGIGLNFTRITVPVGDAHLPLFSCFNGPQTASTAKVENGCRRSIEVVQGQALAAVGDEHMVPVIAVEG